MESTGELCGFFLWGIHLGFKYESEDILPKLIFQVMNFRTLLMKRLLHKNVVWIQVMCLNCINYVFGMKNVTVEFVLSTTVKDQSAV